ncbi:NADH-quinone oxidoreductase subunit C [Aeoliella sp.]|uniref:NADH-quinone oxidoreductase subunit C n=1 Tax=Aeoliella sp. TaxID=2795800 RepID=UPI003CCBE18D
MNFDSIDQRLRDAFREDVVHSETETLDPWVEVTPSRWLEVAKYLKSDPELSFDYLNCITGIDYFHTDPKKAAKAKWEPHLELVYHLTSIAHRHRLVVKLMLPRWSDEAAELLPQVPSVSSVWSTADWHEREVYDLVGVEFTGHADLRRILCPEDWQGHPLRKDYEMPLEYHGIRGR